MTSTPPEISVPDPIVIEIGEDIDDLLSREWLLANRIGAYASSTVIGCPTRRYHGLLVASASPPVARYVALANVMEQVWTPDRDEPYQLAANEFSGTFSPRGFEHQVKFINDAAPTYVYKLGSVELRKQITIADSDNAVAIRYSVRGGDVRIRIAPFVALRDFHHVRRVDQPHQITFDKRSKSIRVQDLKWPEHSVHFLLDGADFQPDTQWWYQLRYRADLSRGQDGIEDLYTPGGFFYEIPDGSSVQFTASADDPISIDFDDALQRRRSRMQSLAERLPDSDETTRRLAIAGDDFVVRRSFRSRNQQTLTTILAGYHWFADWGRDTFIALPGLLIETGRLKQAREVFEMFAENVSEGMIPNRFDDYSSAPHYNSIDASLWCLLAAERYMQATNDETFWRNTLQPLYHAVLKGYRDGTRFGIRADADKLLTGGSLETQLTWMDAKLGNEAITPRQGKPVEVNALWYCAHRVFANRTKSSNPELSEEYAGSAQMIADAFRKTFWNVDGGYLFDCVDDGDRDPSVRPNQIFAVSLPYSPLEEVQKHAVLRIVTQQLLTPMGLRSLSPADHRYRRRYGGSWESRDRAYHQGTVWGWLIGPFIEAYMNVHSHEPSAIEHAKQWLSGFDEHLRCAGLGSVSEIFDGDSPHTPRGCIAQAWSVAEVLRAKRMIARCEQQLGSAR